MKKYIINGITYICATAQPHGYLRDLLIEAQLDGATIEIEDVE